MPYAGPSDAASTATATRPASHPHHHRRTRSSSNFSDERGPGAFAPLGQLPRLNKKAVFHLNNDNDDDNANDDERPSYPTYASPYSPLNSLRLSMNTGKFSPSVDPPSRIDIPPLQPPTSVPFPTSSPISPSDGPSPFFPSNSSSKASSKAGSPSLPRTPSTPIILSNGKPLKSSLKGSSSTPNIPELHVKHLRAQSAPSTPNVIKNVHFAEKDSGLETVRVYNRTGKPASLSKPPGEETETETEAESSFPFPLLPTSPVSATPPPTLIHEIDPSIDRTHPIPKPNPSPYANVFLETLALPRTRPPTLRGTVLVRNLSFEKTVAVRFTLDDWQTTSEVLCKHVVSLPGLPPPFPRARTLGDVAGHIATGQTAEEEKEAPGPAWDRFSFTIRLEDYEAKLSERTLYLVVRYNPGSGGEFWDNNDGQNYRVGFRRATASPLPSPSLLGVAHSQQRTFSAPSTLKTTPTTGSMSPSFASSRHLAVPAPPQLTRSMSSPFPTLSPSFMEAQGHWKEREQKEHERMSERGLGTPTAAYLSRKLSLSNYVAPSTSSAMVTPPTTPPGTVRARSASLPAEVGMAADETHDKSVTLNDEQSKETDAESSSTGTKPVPVQRPLEPLPDFSHATTRSWAGPSSPSAASSTPPSASPLASIPGPSPAALAAQAHSFGPSSYGYAFQHQLLSPPQSKDSSPSNSGTASPKRGGSPEPRSQLKPSALGLEVTNRSESPAPVVDEEERKAAAALSNAVRELGLNASPSAAANANARVDTSDPSYAALLRQWCFAQSTPPAAPSSGVSPTGSPSPRLASAAASAVAGAVGMSTSAVGAVAGTGSGTTTPKVGFGVGPGYGFPGFSFGLPDAGMVGAHMR
ncbi:hypothetical protein BV20DRAFT_979604 [Pilatotrama ljubarskyi]|nr:hypothetical protein BV20DRAFT_979604 [Pilatotrama ljubarskyi]